MLTPTIAQRVLSAALATGGDFAEIFYEDSRVHTLQLLSGKVEQSLGGRDHGAGVRVLRGVDAVYVYTNDTSETGLLQAAQQAAAALGADNARGASINLTPAVAANRSPIRIVPFSVPAARKVELLRQATAAAKAYSPEIGQVDATFTQRRMDVTIANSEGRFVSDERTRIRFVLSAVAEQDGSSQMGVVSPGWQRGFDVLEALDMEAQGREAARQAVAMLHADPCPAGRMPVILNNGFGGVIFHEACGHGLEAAAVARGNSVFCGKLGQRIATPIVTAIDDGTIPNGWGSGNVDDEGNPTQRNVLIQDGILKSYLVDILGGRRMGMAPNGAGRRQSYAYAPTSRMSNTFIVAGQDDDEEMMASLPYGLFARSLGGGSVNPLTGDFNFAVREGYLVRNGQIDRPVKGATLIGKGDEILLHIDRVGKEMRTGQGMCGAASGAIPADVGQPRIRVTEMTVGGQEA